jgi:hypothetical protein
MKLGKYAQAVKNQLEEELLKQGSSLEEFEHSLQNIHHGEGVFKVAVFGEKMMEQTAAKGLGMLGSIPELAFKSSLTGGALAGLSMDEMDSSVEQLNKALAREREKINLVNRLTNNLKREHGLH